MKASCRLHSYRLVVALASFALACAAQTISPLISEYRGKANGSFELRNNYAHTVVAILEPYSFSVDGEGKLTYAPLDSRIHVDLDAASFEIPPGQTHYIFYKATSDQLPAWFAIHCILTPEIQVKAGLRVSVVLTEFVYISQKSKFRANDVQVRLLPGTASGYRLEIANQSDKLGRVEFVETTGFNRDAEMGGFPLFPGQTRQIVLGPGLPKKQPKIRLHFEDGFEVDQPITGKWFEENRIH
jgi:hypothetical protein